MIRSKSGVGTVSSKMPSLGARSRLASPWSSFDIEPNRLIRLQPQPLKGHTQLQDAVRGHLHRRAIGRQLTLVLNARHRTRRSRLLDHHLEIHRVDKPDPQPINARQVMPGVAAAPCPLCTSSRSSENPNQTSRSGPCETSVIVPRSFPHVYLAALIHSK